MDEHNSNKTAAGKQGEELRDAFGEGDWTTAVTETALENHNLRLFLVAAFEQIRLLTTTLDEKITDINTESDPRFNDLRRLRTIYLLWKEEPDDPRLADFFNELSGEFEGQGTPANPLMARLVHSKTVPADESRSS